MIVKKIYLNRSKQKVPFLLSDNQSGLLMPVGDIHFGDPNFPEDHFKVHLEWGMDRGAIFLGMGDYADFAPESQRKALMTVRDSTQQLLDDMVRAKLDRLIEIMMPTKNRWIGLLEGNHSWPFLGGRSSTQYICEALGKGCDYLGDMTYLRIVCDGGVPGHPEADTIVIAHHGIGGGTTVGGQLLKPEQLLKWSNADVILMGHSHSKNAGAVDRLLVTPDGTTSHRTTIVARTGAFLKAYEGIEPFDLDQPAYLSAGSYVEKKALMPSSMGGLCFSIGTEKIRGSKYYRPVIHYSV